MNTTTSSFEDVIKYIPQRFPFVMVDKLLYVDEIKTISNFIIIAKNIFCETGFFSENGMIENIAQTAAAGFGYADSLSEKEVSLGYIAAIKDIVISELPSVNSTLITETEVVNQILDFKIINGKIKVNDAVIASCEMRIFVKP